MSRETFAIGKGQQVEAVKCSQCQKWLSFADMNAAATGARTRYSICRHCSSHSAAELRANDVRYDDPRQS